MSALQTLQFENLSFERACKPIFQHINTTLGAGDLLEISGENGSGKTTLLRGMAGLLRLSGTIRLNGQAIKHDHAQYQQHLHFVSHQNALQQHLTVIEYLKLYSVLAQITMSAEDIQLALSSLALRICLDEKIAYLSAGQKRKLSLAKLILHPKPIWILDEPFNAVDNKGQFNLLKLFHQHLTNRGMLIIATHQPLQLHPAKKQIVLENAYV